MRSLLALCVFVGSTGASLAEGHKPRITFVAVQNQMVTTVGVTVDPAGQKLYVGVTLRTKRGKEKDLPVQEVSGTGSVHRTWQSMGDSTEYCVRLWKEKVADSKNDMGYIMRGLVDDTGWRKSTRPYQK